MKVSTTFSTRSNAKRAAEKAIGIWATNVVFDDEVAEALRACYSVMEFCSDMAPGMDGWKEWKAAMDQACAVLAKLETAAEIASCISPGESS